MIRTKLGLLGLCAVVVGMMAMSAGAAQGAFSWLILNEAKTVATDLLALVDAKLEGTHASLDGEVAGLKIAVTCTAFTLTNVHLVPGGTLNNTGTVTFTGCKVYEAAPLTKEYKCTVKSPGAAAGTVATTVGNTGKLVLVEGEVQTQIEPAGGPTGNFATLRFEGAECILPEVNQVHGTLLLKDCLGQATTHVLEHLIESGKSTKLYVGGHSAKQLEVTKILGSAWVFLIKEHEGRLWSGMDA